MPHDGNERSQRIPRLIAVVAGLAGLLLCAVVPLLPVKQTTATVLWPQGSADGHVTQITAPLVSGAPRALDISIPCSAMATLPPGGGLVVSTLPAGGVDTGKNGLFVRADKDVIVVAFRDTVATVANRAAVAAGACSVLHLWADVGAAGAEFVGIPGASGTLPSEKKPQVGGIFTDLKMRPQPGLSARIDIDTRFITAPTVIKEVVMAVGALAVLVAILELAALDRRGRLPRYRPRVLWTTWLADAGVIATLLLWHVIGATSSDDGYNLTIARIAPKAGYVANYYRYFGATEAPFDWYFSTLSRLAAISTAGVWMRLPATLAGIGCWLIISRWVLRRLGPARGGLAANPVAVLTAGVVFVAAWLPFNNGLRPEPLIALGALLTWMLVERAIALGRVAPFAVAIVVAMLTATLAPQGLIAVAALLTGARAIAQVIRRRRATDGLLAPLLVLAASLSAITLVVFRSQTLATVAESARIKYKVGPTIAWYQDWLRYYFLTVESNAEGSMARRFAVLVMLLCVFGMLVVLLRRGRVPGLASGPAWRLIGTTAVGLLLLTFTPTKWAVQFGAFAGLAGALGGVTAFALARIGLHNRRNLTLYVTALLFVLAVATSGINGWFYVGNYGVPWYDIQPVISTPTPILTLSLLIGLLAFAWSIVRLVWRRRTSGALLAPLAVLAASLALAATSLTPILVLSILIALLAFAWSIVRTVSLRKAGGELLAPLAVLAASLPLIAGAVLAVFRSHKLASHPVTSIFLTLSILTGLLAAWQHFRMDYAGHTEVKDNRRNRVLASTPLLVVATIMVVGEVASLTKGAVFRYPLYTIGKANLAAISSGLSKSSCAMADDVLAELDPNAGLLQPVPGQAFGPDGPLGGINPVGFKPDGVGDDLRSYPVVTKPGVVNSDASPNKPNAAMSDSAGTAGGKGPAGINGSHAALPFGLDPARTPVMGSYGENSLAGSATSAWYQLPRNWKEGTAGRPIVVVSASGAIWSHKEDGTLTYGQPLKLQWGIARPDGTTQPLKEVEPIDVGPEPAWRNLRFPLTWAPPEANVARIVAYDPNLSSDQWFAFTPPRVPVLQTLQQLMGSRAPVLMDIATAANFPCQRPFSEHLGVAELPRYRILPDHKQTASSSNGWQASETGGPFLFTQALLRTSTISTYLRGDWHRDWGSVEQYFRLVPADQAPDAVVDQGVMTVHGWSRQGPIRALP